MDGPKSSLDDLNAILYFLMTGNHADKFKMVHLKAMHKQNAPVMRFEFDDGDNPWYDVYWWNGQEDYQREHSLVVESSKSDGRLEYYLRFVMPSKDQLEWQWFNNDEIEYKSFHDKYGVDAVKQFGVSLHGVIVYVVSIMLRLASVL